MEVAPGDEAKTILRSLGSGRNSSNATPLLPSSTCPSNLASAQNATLPLPGVLGKRFSPHSCQLLDPQMPIPSTPQLRAQLVQLPTTLPRQIRTKVTHKRLLKSFLLQLYKQLVDSHTTRTPHQCPPLATQQCSLRSRGPLFSHVHGQETHAPTPCRP